MAFLILRALILKSMRWVGVVFQMRMLTTSVKVVTTVSSGQLLIIDQLINS